MSVQARWVQIIVTRDLAARLPRRDPAVDFSTRLMCWHVLHFLAILPNSYATHLLRKSNLVCSLPAHFRGTHKKF